MIYENISKLNIFEGDDLKFLMLNLRFQIS